jgi:uncharacterized membrane protein
MRHTKLEKSKDVEDAIAYLRQVFYKYATSERYNFTEQQFYQQVVFTLHKSFSFYATFIPLLYLYFVLLNGNLKSGFDEK